MANLNKPETATTTDSATGTNNTAAVGTISVNVGVPGNIKKLVLEGNGWTVKDVLKYAEIDANGYDIRVSGQPSNADTPVTDGQTVLLLRPVRGNVDLGKNENNGGTISVNVGVPGNIKKLVLEGNSWTVQSVLRQAEVDASGYDIRVSGQPASLTTAVTDGQTVLLLRPVRGNVDLNKDNGGATGTISVNVGVPGNIKKLVLEGNSWTVQSVLRQAEVDASGYDIRVSGQPASLTTAVTDGQTVLLLRPVRGN